MSSSWPIIVVTGANSGVGFGFCHRLLTQLSSKQPSDLRQCSAFFTKEKAKNSKYDVVHDGLILILACRNRGRAEQARIRLYTLLDQHIARLKRSPSYDGHADTFRGNLQIAIHCIDLSSVSSIFQFSDELSQKYPYISHLVCNAGYANFESLHWPMVIKALVTNWVVAVTRPTFILQASGEVSPDGLGMVWQCNLFGHYTLFRCLQTLIACSPPVLSSRVIWVSSHEASSYADASDWQLLKSAHSYQNCKYQIDLIVQQLDRRSLRQQQQIELAGGDHVVERHLIMLPAVAVTSIAREVLGPITTLAMLFAMYIARWLGSPYHPINPFKASISAVWLCLVPLSLLPATMEFNVRKLDTSMMSREVTPKYISETDRWGRERVGILPLFCSEQEEKLGGDLLEKCEKLLKSFCEAQKRPVPPNPLEEQ